MSSRCGPSRGARARHRPRPVAERQTLFIEPEHVVDANNDLVQATREEQHEIARILADLTTGVRARLDDLETLVGAIGEARLDVRAGQAPSGCARPRP